VFGVATAITLSLGGYANQLSLSLHFALLVFVLGRAYFRYFCQVLFSELYLLIPAWEAAMFRTIHLPVLSIVSTGWLAVFLRWIYFALVCVWCGGLHTFFFFLGLAGDIVGGSGKGKCNASGCRKVEGTTMIGCRTRTLMLPYVF